MLRFALRHFNQKQPFAIQFSVMGVYTNGRLDGVSADFHQSGIEFDDLFTRHGLNFARVGSAAEQYAAVRVGKSSDFIGPIIAARTSRTVPRKLDPIEFPLAILAQAKLALDL